MKKSLFILCLALLAALGAKADITADWKLHMPYDQWATSVIDTPERVYFTGRTFENSRSIPDRQIKSNSLFYYDKKGDEIIPVNARNLSTGNNVAVMHYNADKKYLIVVYSDCDIDFIYDDGRVFNVPALKAASIPGKKEANYITFDDSRNLVYIATTFGYIALNDNKHEVAESRNYSTNVESIGRSQDNIIMCVDGQLMFAPASEKRFNISDYKTVEGAPEVNAVVPLKHTSQFFAYKTSYDSYITAFFFEDDTYTWRQFYSDPQIFNIQCIPGGYRIGGNVRIYEITHWSGTKVLGRPEVEYAKPATTYDGKDVWFLHPQKGLRSYKNNGDQWDYTLTRDFMRPNAPATYIATSASYHPTYGMLVGSNGYDVALYNFNQSTPANVSALKGGFWKEFGPNYTNPGFLPSATNYFGVSIDNKNPNHIYRGSAFGGLMRLNLADPNDILIFSHPSDANASSKGFVKVNDDLAAWRSLCRFAAPQFTADGTMWTTFFNADDQSMEFWYWPAADRAATTSPASYRPMKKIKAPKIAGADHGGFVALTKNKNMLAIGNNSFGGSVLIYDHNGTPDVTNDDRYVFINNPYDQDGGGVSFLDVNALVEDPETGLLWIMTQRGLFTVNPATAFENPNQVNRIKVARNDGTNLADYLLNEINVNHMSIDGEGRKWFGTSNGLVCTASDGRSILGEFTAENSYLPDNNVYATAYNPENNSLMVCTGGGLAEMFPSGSGGNTSSSENTARAFPNPVEPDYYGWVRIDNIADGSLVKITDSRGGIVKELGPAQGGSVEWDVSGLNNTRVATGVYYIMVSPGANSSGKTQIVKILVLN